MELPRILPILPISGVVLLPGNRLPLHVFEDPYAELVEDALRGEGCVGVIQPLEPETEKGDLLDALAPTPLQQVGCAGQLLQSHALPDRRYVVVIAGVSRFRVERELPRVRGYRRVVVDYSPFAQDQLPVQFDPSRLLTMLALIDQQIGGGIDYQRLAELPGLTLLNQLSALLPFTPDEKQALLEADDADEREEVLLTLLEMGMLAFPEGFNASSDQVM
jgi:uncharacterized protein